MKKIRLGMILAISSTLLLCSCKSGGAEVFKSETTAAPAQNFTEVEPPNGAIAVSTGYDWEQVMESVQEILNKDDFPLGEYLDYYVEEDTKTIGLVWPLSNEADIDTAFEYMAAYIKAFNDSTHTQNFNIELSTDTSYGSLWKEYNLHLEAFRIGDIAEIEKSLIRQSVSAGSDIVLEEYVHEGEGSALEIPLDQLQQESDSASKSSN